MQGALEALGEQQRKEQEQGRREKGEQVKREQEEQVKREQGEQGRKEHEVQEKDEKGWSPKQERWEAGSQLQVNMFSFASVNLCNLYFVGCSVLCLVISLHSCCYAG